MMKEFFVFEGTNPKRSQFVKLTNIVEKKKTKTNKHEDEKKNLKPGGNLS